VARSTPRAPVRLWGDVGQVGQGWRVPERWDGGEAEEKLRGGGVHRRGGAPVVTGGGDEVLQLRRGEGVRDLQEIIGIGSSRRSSPGSSGRGGARPESA
jgi:hypothetical protein